MAALLPSPPSLEALEARVLLSSPAAVAEHPFAASTTAINRAARKRQRRAAKAVINYRAAALFPVAAGATWTYRSGTDIVDQAIDGVPTTLQGVTTAKLVTSRNGETIEQATVTLGDNGVRLLQRSMMLPGATDQESFAGGVPVLPFAVRTGAKAAFKIKWQGVADTSGGGGQSVAWAGTDSRKLQVLGFQTITVPAGSFKAMLVRQTRAATQIQANNGPLSVSLSTTIDSWYAPGVGLVRSITTTRRTAHYNNVVVETATTKKVTDLLTTNQAYAPPRPELVSAMRGPATIDAIAGRKIKVESIVRNLGQESARPSTVTLYFSTDRTIDFTDPAAGGASVKALAPGQSLVRSIALQLPRRPGTYFIATFADAASEVDEPNRDNNWSSPIRVVVRKSA